MSSGFCERDGPSSAGGGGTGAVLAGSARALAVGGALATVAVGLGGGALAATAGALIVESEGRGAGGGRVPHAARTQTSGSLRNTAARAGRWVIGNMRREHTPTAHARPDGAKARKRVRSAATLRAAAPSAAKRQRRAAWQPRLRRTP